MPDDLWGELPDGADIRTPHAILLEQAELLTTKTKGLLVGRISQSTNGDQFTLNMAISAPSLSYVHVVLTATHSIVLYPVRVGDHTRGAVIDCKDENSFIDTIRSILSSESVKKVVGGLLAQIKASKPKAESTV